ncbi:site-2 protease family protein [Angustibacter sp. McL0619]|uniref:site-2 protease family protein n=1 Tax=Angustibacter sp. McL0619 TaxID=3415676 RepID=UPI003CE75A91
MNNRPGLQLARVAGFPVYLAPSWFVIAALVVVLFAPQVEVSAGLRPPQTYLVAAAYALLLLASVLVHELAHAFTARAVGLPVEQVVADLWGGHTQFSQEAPDPGRSALVAVAGPLSNAVLAGIGVLVLPGTDGEVTRLLVVAGIYANAFVAAFNLAPGLPLDGGRLVEAAVWAVSRRRWAGTLVAGWCGRVVAAGVVLWLVLLPLLDNRRPTAFGVVWAVLVAGLLWRGASGAVELGQVLRSAQRLDLGSYLEPARALPLASTGWRPAPSGGHVVALDEHGRPVGILRMQDAMRHVGGQQAPGPQTPLSAVMTVLPSVVVVPADLSGEGVLRTLATNGAHVLVAVDPTGHVVGVADAQRLAHALTGRP